MNDFRLVDDLGGKVTGDYSCLTVEDERYDTTLPLHDSRLEPAAQGGSDLVFGITNS